MIRISKKNFLINFATSEESTKTLNDIFDKLENSGNNYKYCRFDMNGDVYMVKMTESLEDEGFTLH